MRKSSGATDGLRGLKVLVAEDHALIVLDIEATLLELGCALPTSTPSVAGALAALRAGRPDAVLLDASLADGPAEPVAAVLAAAGVPFAVLTGHDRCRIADPLMRAAPYLAKPYRRDELRATLQHLAAVGPGRHPRPAFPPPVSPRPVELWAGL